MTVVLKHVRDRPDVRAARPRPRAVYLVPLLPIGAYEVTFTLPGFQPRVVRGVTLSVNDRI